MRRRRFGCCFLAALPILLAGALSGCKEGKLTSVWRGERAIAIDGRKGDWSGIDVYSFEDEKVFIGLANDAESIYILVIASDRMLAVQALTRGLRVRLRPEKGDRALWIGTPAAVRLGRAGGAVARDGAPGDPDDLDRGGRGRGMDGPGEGPGDERIKRAVADLPSGIQLYARSGEDSLRLSAGEAAERGIEMVTGMQSGYLVIEIKALLLKDSSHPLGVGVPAGALAPGKSSAASGSNGPVVELCFKVPKGERRSMGSEGRGEGGPPRDDGGGWQPDRDRGSPEEDGGGRLPEGDDPGGGGASGSGGLGGSHAGGPGRFHEKMMNGLDQTVEVRLSRP